MIEIHLSNVESMPSGALRNIAGLLNVIASYADSLTPPQPQQVPEPAQIAAIEPVV